MGQEARGRGSSPPSIIDQLLHHAEVSPERIAITTLRRSVVYSDLVVRVWYLAGLLEPSPPGPIIIQPSDAVALAVGCGAAIARSRTFIVVDRTLSSDAVERFATSVNATVVLCDAVNVAVLASSTLVAIDIEAPGTAPLLRVDGGEGPMAFASTSGSTGRPKLVSIFEQEVLLVLDGFYGDADLLASDIPFFPLSPATFTVVGVLRGLAMGITTVCADPRAIPLSEIVAGIRSSQVTFVRVAPSVLRRLVRCVPDGESLPAIRTIQCTGEPLLWSDIGALRRILSTTAVVHNRLGMTETGELSVMSVRVHDPIADRGAVPVGKALPGRRVLIVDEDGVMVDQGEDGEIVFEGDFHRAAEGMERRDDGWTRFPTGDVGCIDAAGDLVLRGRSDRMVKIGGVRVEPALVEEAIRGVPGVVDVAVIPVLVAVGELRLAALTVTTTPPVVTVEQIRAAVHRTVSAAAVPVRVVMTSTPLPLLQSGKSDLRRLTELLTPEELPAP